MFYSFKDVIGKYEREGILQSIEVFGKLAKVFDVSAYLLLGEGQYATYYKNVVKWLDDVEKLHILHYMDLRYCHSRQQAKTIIE